MSRLNKILVTLLFGVVLLSACSGGSTKAVSGHGDTLRLTHARHLTIVKYPQYTVVSLADPWEKGHTLHTYVLVPRTNKQVDESQLPQGTIVHTPIARSVVFTTVHSSLLLELGVGTAIKGVCDLKYINCPWIQQQVASGHVADCGNGMNADVEKIMATKADAVLLSPFENSGGYGRLEQIGIPLIECADYMEVTALGRAEWMKFYGLLFGCEQRADSLFSKVEQRYMALRAKVAPITEKPTVITERNTGAVWYVPGGASVIGTMIADAGGWYAFAGDKSQGSLSLPFETVLAKAGESDVWMYKYNSHPATLAELLAEYHGYEQLHAYRTGKVFGADCDKVPYYEEASFHPDRVLRDMIIMLHPELKMGALRYYHAIH